MEKLTMEKLVNYCKQYGFVFQDSEIYGGLSNSWDYGPLGRELKENIKRAWWKKFIQEEKNSYGLDVITSMSDILKDEYDLAIIAVNHNCIAGASYNAKMTINLEKFI